MAGGPEELRHGGMTFGADASAFQNLDNRKEEDLDIEPDAPVVYLPDVELELLFPTEAVAAADLRPAGDAGLDFVPPGLLGGVAVEVFHEERPRADEAHLPAQDVDELRQLVEAGPAEEPAQAGEAFLVRKKAAFFIPVLGHGAEFKHDKGFAVQTGPHLAESTRPAHGEADKKGDEKKNGE